MAFCAKVDSEGNEIERQLLTGRSTGSRSSLYSCSTESETIKNLSSRTYSKASAFTTHSGSLRFNSSSSYTSESSKDDQVSDSFSWAETGTFDSRHSESPSDVVPPLDLQSDTTSINYCNPLKSAKLTRPNDQAYDSWLSAKMKNLNTKAEDAKREKEQKKREAEERKRMSEAVYKNWLRQKSENEAKIKQHQQQLVQARNAPKQSQVVKQRQVVEIDSVEQQRRLEEWERNKRLEDERRRRAKQVEEERRRQMEEQRQTMSKQAWKKWIADAPKKPKPVPLNQGIHTLRGTISDIFVNPNEWKSIIDDTN